MTIRTVCAEDFPASEGMQRGFASGAQTHATYGRNEPALFRQLVLQGMACDYSWNHPGQRYLDLYEFIRHK